MKSCQFDGTRRECPGERILLALILVGLLAALVYQARETGVTVDEPSHLLSSYLYWRGADRLRPSDMPPLIKVIGGWVPRRFGLPVPEDLGKPGDTRGEWESALVMMDKLERERARTIFFYARLCLAVFPLLTVVLLWHWARCLFGPVVGLLLALAWALEPTALAHGALFKNDLAATFGYLLFWYCAWRFWRQPGVRAASVLAAAALLAMTSKMSMLILAGIAPGVVVLRYLTRPRMGARTATLALILVVLVPYAGMIAATQFEAGTVPPAELASLAEDSGVPKWFAAAAGMFGVLPVPTRIWTGCVSLIHDQTASVPVYLWGNIFPGGTTMYFPAALAVKMPEPLQILLVFGLLVVLRRLTARRLEGSDALWLLPGFVYIGLASFASLQLGVRLVLPALPFGLLLCGAAIERLWNTRAKVAVASLIVWLAVQSARTYPHGLSFFNACSGGPENAICYLSDSNVDWGQGLPELREFFDKHHLQKITLSYFGTESTWRYFSDQEIELIAPPWSDELAAGERIVPKPGVYAISASLLTGHFFDSKYRKYYQVFRQMEPAARIADSIYIYKLEAAGISVPDSASQ